MKGNFYIYLAVMALTTYLVRALPFTIFTRKIENVRFRSFLKYVPYAVLTAMTVPSIFYSTGSIWSAFIGFAVAVILSLMKRDMLTVAVMSCIAVYISELIIL